MSLATKDVATRGAAPFTGRLAFRHSKEDAFGLVLACRASLALQQ